MILLRYAQSFFLSTMNIKLRISANNIFTIELPSIPKTIHILVHNSLMSVFLQNSSTYSTNWRLSSGSISINFWSILSLKSLIALIIFWDPDSGFPCGWGVIIQWKAYVADAYSELAHSWEETTRTVTEAHPGNKNNRKYDKKIIITEYEKTKLIPWNEYIKTRKIKRVVFHDAPWIDNKITSNDYKGHKEEKIEWREELTKLKNTLLRSGAISKGNFSNGMWVPYDNFEKDWEKILASIYEHARSPFEPALILAQMMRESWFSENALSHRWAQWYMQFMPWTAKWREVDAGDLDSSVKWAVDYLEHIHVRSFQWAGNLRKTLWWYNAWWWNIKHIIDSPSWKWKEPKKYANNIPKKSLKIYKLRISNM